MVVVFPSRARYTVCTLTWNGVGPPEFVVAVLLLDAMDAIFSASLGTAQIDRRKDRVRIFGEQTTNGPEIF